MDNDSEVTLNDETGFTASASVFQPTQDNYKNKKKIEPSRN